MCAVSLCPVLSYRCTAVPVVSTGVYGVQQLTRLTYIHEDSHLSPVGLLRATDCGQVSRVYLGVTVSLRFPKPSRLSAVPARPSIRYRGEREEAEEY